jgi:hypothetical protein
VIVLVEFGAADEALRALKTLASLGYVHIDTHAPFPLTDEAAYAPRGSMPLAFLGFGGGLTALVAAYLVQWYANVASYPLNIGGRPADAAAAFLPTTFESICLMASLAVFGGFLIFERLPRLWQPIFDVEGFERASIDRFWLSFEVHASTTADSIAADVLPLHPLRIVLGEERE